MRLRSPLRIGLVLPGFSADENDGCIPALSKLVRGLADEHDVHVFALRYPHLRGEYSAHGAAVHALGGADARDGARLRFLSSALWQIRKEHRRRAFDVLHGIWADEPGWVAVTSGRLLKLPTVVTLLGGELVGFPDIGYGSQLSRVNAWMVRTALSRATVVTAGSTYLRNLAEPHAAGDRVRFLPLGVDTSLFQPGFKGELALREGNAKLLHVASLVPVKHQENLLRALPPLVRIAPGIHLHVVGDGPLRPNLEAAADALGVASHVTFHGAVPHDRLPEYYRAADLCVMASRHEGQEWVTQEAAACGCPTVGTAVGVVPDLVPAARAVPVGDVEALTRELARLALDPSRAQTMGQVAREAAEKRYALSLTLKNLRSLYAELTGRDRTRGDGEI